MEDKAEKAVELFKKGYNCSQAVFTAFADEYGITEKNALLLSSSFGGGIGRMGQTCGAACALFMLAGLETGSTESENKQQKEENYRVVQQLAQKFIEKNGALTCEELLKLKKETPVTHLSEERNPAYYSKRPCVKIVEEAARVW
ncbi:MAG: C-GCAxxG-C-C family protein, partial [Bacteroides sp.]|nr:C-GCAxxG-C-C family protein [Bacteroides sp.]